MLPVIKNLIERISKVYQPIGLGVGDESKDHFHTHMVSKYKKSFDQKIIAY